MFKRLRVRATVCAYYALLCQVAFVVNGCLLQKKSITIIFYGIASCSRRLRRRFMVQLALGPYIFLS